MKVIIAGSRSFSNEKALTLTMAAIARFEAAKYGGPITKIISGGAKGPDRVGELEAKRREIPLEVLKPEYDKYGRRAPLVRNAEMAAISDALIAVWDGVSRGTKHMIDCARDRNLTVLICQAEAGKRIQWRNILRGEN